MAVTRISAKAGESKSMPTQKVAAAQLPNLDEIGLYLGCRQREGVAQVPVSV